MLCVNIGNSNIGIAYLNIIEQYSQNSTQKYSLKNGSEQSFSYNIDYEFKIKTSLEKNARDYFELINKNIKELSNKKKIENCPVSISSVVPAIDGIICEVFEKYFKIKPYFIRYHNNLKLKQRILIRNPEKIGIDRIANAEYCVEHFGDNKNLIIIDSGTATTIDVIKCGDFIGGVIAPGISAMNKSLIECCAKLYETDLTVIPEKIVGNETSESIQSGIIHGFGSMIEGLLEKIKTEQKFDDCIIICSGGNAEIIKQLVNSVNIILDEKITYKGIRIIYEKNKQYL